MILTAQAAIAELVAAGGDPSLAAAQVSVQTGDPTTAGELLAAIAKDPASPAILYSQLRMLMVLKSFDAFSKTHLAYLQQIAQLPPKDLAKTYSNLVDSFAQLTNSTPQPVNNTIDDILKLLPPEVSDAVNALMAPSTPDAVEAGASDAVFTPAAPAGTPVTPPRDVHAAVPEDPPDLEWQIPTRG